MKKQFTLSILAAVLLLFMGTGVFAQNHVDPDYLQIQSAENPITIDGELNETDWERRMDHLIFRHVFKPGDVEYDVTDGVMVDESGTHTDTTTTIVKILHYGLDLYISLKSDDKYVNKWGGSWEGDGLFMKVQKADGGDVEFKLFYTNPGVDPDIKYETGGCPESWGEGCAWEPTGTVVNDTSQQDEGYTAELLIHLDSLGYTTDDIYCEIPVIINIFDPDGQTGTAGEQLTVGSFYKRWWGSEWGSPKRTLRLADPPSRTAKKTSAVITLDGQLNESFWIGADSLIIAEGSHLSTGGYYMQWSDPLNEYTDKSSAVVKFIHNGTDLYIGIVSNDSSVCKWNPGWECDGLYMHMTYKGIIPAPGDRMPIRLWYSNSDEGSSAVLDIGEATLPTGSADGASYEPDGTVTQTETNGTDEGYSMELVVHTSEFGYVDGDTVKLTIEIYDMDYASADAYDEHVSDFRPLWWATQWAATDFEKYYLYRDVILSSIPVGIDDEQPLTTKTFRLKQNYPNPFNPSTTIIYELPHKTDVKVEIFNILGKKITGLLDQEQVAGSHKIVWNGRDAGGAQPASGIYFYRISTPKFTKTMKMILMK